MLTVLHVVEATFAGVGRHVVDLAQAQVDQGFDVHVAAASGRQSADFAAARKRLSAVTWHELEMPRLVGLNDLTVWPRFKALASDVNPDVVHGHSTKGGLFARSLVGGRAAVVYTPHAAYAMNPSAPALTRRIAASVERWLSRRTDAVIAVSDEEASFLRAVGLPATKIHTVPNGIAPVERADRDRVRLHLGLPAGRPTIGFVGRLEEQKAPDDLLKIFEGVARSEPLACFVVVGAGSFRTMFVEAASRPPLQGRLHVVGQQPGTWAMSAFDVLVLPSRYEGFPYVLVEAAHLGLPSVVSDRATSALLEAGPATVHSVALGDVDGFVDRVQMVLSDYRAAQLSGTEVLDFGSDRRFSISGMARATAKVYRLALAGERGLSVIASEARADDENPSVSVDDVVDISTGTASGESSLRRPSLAKAKRPPETE